MLNVYSSPYHPQTNGLAERFIGTLKRRVLKRGKGFDNTRLWKFLKSYRNSPHVTTGKTSSELMIGRRLPTLFDNIRPDITRSVESALAKQKQKHDEKSRPTNIEEGQPIWYREHRKGIWKPATVKHKTSPVSFRINSADGTKRVHGDDIRHREERETESGETGNVVEVQINRTGQTNELLDGSIRRLNSTITLIQG